MRNKLILSVLLLVRKAAGFRILRRQMRCQECARQVIVQKIMDSIKNLNETNQKSIIGMQKQLDDLSVKIKAISDNSSASWKALEKQLQEVHSEFKNARTDYSQKMQSLTQSLDTNSPQKDIFALSEQISRTEETMNNIVQDIQAIDKAQSLILINQVMELAEDTILPHNAEKQ